jgi:tRNA A-37 threonylcarbamoyl transferase component Bud32
MPDPKPEVRSVLEQRLVAFHEALRRGERPDPEAFLPDGPGRHEALIELVHAELEYRLKAGEPARAADYLARYPTLGADPAAAGSLAAAELRLRRRLPGPPGSDSPLPSSPASLGADQTQVTNNPGAAPAPGDVPFADGRYELLEELGRGGMGVVYKARQKKLNRLVALKMILAGAHAAPAHLVRFRCEAEAVAQLQHPHIVQIYEIGETDRKPFFSLEYVDGGSLAQYLAGTPQPPPLAAQLTEKLARAVDYAHRRGIIHRDLKPANVLLTADKTPKITDFGLAKHLEGDGQGQTQSGALVGTPSYMAPEQAAGWTKKIGPPTDVYALGVILYEMLTGRPPFRAASLMDTLEQVRFQEPIPPSRLHPKLPRDLETICLKCLEKEPHKRYASAEALAGDLRHFLASEPIQARPPNLISRTWLWCHRPERIRDAGAFTVFLGIVCIIWCLSGIGFIAGGLLRPARPTAAIVQLTAFVFVIYLPLIWIGLGTMTKKRFFLCVGAAVAVLDLVNSIFCLIGSNMFSDLCDLGGMHNDPNVRIPVFSLLGILVGVQFVGYSIALLASFSNRGTLR